MDSQISGFILIQKYHSCYLYIKMHMNNMTDIFSGKTQQGVFFAKMTCGRAGINPSLPYLCICDNKKDLKSLAAEAWTSLAGLYGITEKQWTQYPMYNFYSATFEMTGTFTNIVRDGRRNMKIALQKILYNCFHLYNSFMKLSLRWQSSPLEGQQFFIVIPRANRCLNTLKLRECINEKISFPAFWDPTS